MLSPQYNILNRFSIEEILETEHRLEMLENDLLKKAYLDMLVNESILEDNDKYLEHTHLPDKTVLLEKLENKHAVITYYLKDGEFFIMETDTARGKDVCCKWLDKNLEGKTVKTTYCFNSKGLYHKTVSMAEPDKEV